MTNTERIKDIIRPTKYKLKNNVTITIRPINPEDSKREQDFIRSLSTKSRYSRFMSALNELTPKQLHYFTHNKPPKHMALIATQDLDNTEVQIGVARYVFSESDNCAEFAVVVADEWQGKGIAYLLLKSLANYAKSVGIKNVSGLMFKSNKKMHTLAKELDLKIEVFDQDPTLYKVTGSLQ